MFVLNRLGMCSPIVVSVESKNPGEGLLAAQTQVGVWQAAQWSLFERQSGNIGDLPILPVLLIQGSH